MIVIRCDVGVHAEGREDAGRTAGEKRQSIAAEIILVDAADAGEERMMVVDLPGKACHLRSKSDKNMIQNLSRYG